MLEDWNSYRNVLNILAGPEIKKEKMQEGIKHINVKIIKEAVKLSVSHERIGISLPKLAKGLRRIRLLDRGGLRLWRKIERKEKGL